MIIKENKQMQNNLAMPSAHIKNSILQIKGPNHDPYSQLNSMGLTQDIIEQTIANGLIAFKSVSALHPVTAGGANAWAEIIATLRRLLLGLNCGWGYTHQNGLSITHNKNLGISLLATSGDKDTGKINGFPCTKNKKGPSTRDIVFHNMMNDLFDTNRQDSNVEELNVDQTKTWILLYHIDKGLKQIRFELSLPCSTTVIKGDTEKLKIDSWNERIIFNPIPFENINITAHVKEQKFSDDVIFDIIKKA